MGCAKLLLVCDEKSSNTFSPLFQADVAKTIDVARNRKQASSFNGVTTNGKSPMPWKAQAYIAGTMKFLGTYATEREAADAFDVALREICNKRKVLLTRLNVKTDEDYFSHDAWQSEPIPEGSPSRFMGVSRIRHKWRARTIRNLIHIGVFESELGAAVAFDEDSSRKGGRTNFHPRNYSS